MFHLCIWVNGFLLRCQLPRSQGETHIFLLFDIAWPGFHGGFIDAQTGEQGFLFPQAPWDAALYTQAEATLHRAQVPWLMKTSSRLHGSVWENVTFMVGF